MTIDIWPILQTVQKTDPPIAFKTAPDQKATPAFGGMQTLHPTYKADWATNQDG